MSVVVEMEYIVKQSYKNLTTQNQQLTSVEQNFEREILTLF